MNLAIQRAGGDWRDGAADAATGAMRELRGFDDRMQFTSNLAGVRAFGQSDGAGGAMARGAGGPGAAAPFGVGPVTGRDEDREHQARYGLPATRATLARAIDELVAELR